MNRGSFLKFAVCSAVVAAFGMSPAHAQAYPSKPITIIVPFAPGGAVDILARMLSEKMSPRLGVPVIIENRAGAAGNIGVAAAAKATPDGYTATLALSSNLMINQFLYSSLPYHPGKDFTLVAKVADAPLLLVANQQIPANTPQELKKYIAENKGTLSYGSWGAGTVSHLSGSAVNDMAGGDMIHAPYKGESPMVQDLVGGLLSMSFATGAQAPQFIKSGKLKAIGVTGTSPIPALPDVPPLVDSGFDDPLLRSVGWVALAVPAGTPSPVVGTLQQEVEYALAQDDIQKHIQTLGWLPRFSSSADLTALYESEAPMWKEVIERSGVRLD